MIYVVYGLDTFSVKGFIDKVKSLVGPDDVRDANTTSVLVSEISLPQIIFLCSFVPFLSERRLVIVEGLLMSLEPNRRQPSRRGRTNAIDQGEPTRKPLGSNEWENFVSGLNSIPSTTDVIFSDGQLTRSNPLLKQLSQIAEIHEFKPLGRDDVQQWIRRRTSQSGTEISSQALQLLTQLIGNDLWSGANEIAKLTLHCRGNRIELADVQTLVNPIGEINIFPAIDAALVGDVKRALTILRDLIAKGAPVNYPLGMLSRQVRNLLIAKSLIDSEFEASIIRDKLGIDSPYALREIMNLARRISQTRLIKIHQVLLDTDVAIKTGSISEEISLQIAIAEICNTKFSV